MSKRSILEIILVEDNDFDAELTIRALQEGRISNPIFRITDGQELLDFLFPPDSPNDSLIIAPPRLILLDLKLPRIDGLEVLKVIKSDTRTKWIPVVVLTSSTEETDMIKSYHLGVNSYIVKPVDFDNFTATVKQLGLYWVLLNQIPTKSK